jgi:hypothetical protein
MKPFISSPDLHVRIARLVIDATALDEGFDRSDRLESLVRSALQQRLDGDRSNRSHVVANTIADRVTSAIEPLKGR